MKNLLEGKTILVTGANRGLGEVVARSAKENGATVILHGRREEEVRKIAEELQSDYIICDASNEQEVKIEVEKLLQKIRRIDVLINNAADPSPPTQYLEDITISNLDYVIKTNVYSVIFFSKAVIKAMKEQKSGKIVNVASIRGLVGKPGRSVYALSKAAVINLTKTLAVELAPYVTVNSVSPGPIDKKETSEEQRKIWKKKSLLNKLPTTKDIAEVIIFLCSSEANFITGQNIVVDGGESLSVK
ncbi:MAG: hypothetical protein A2864_00170 [Candidatus Woykebacteria bacterium RIFCSPHIGHO2_01_FULL_39_12]|uniref:Short-chain dehydrogenase n=2 Tax=Candidatus Woykeibacteriota TaxID=1817899 RepID=A0A1G1WDV6_9BACT|nr:MAG: hypothetical protein A2134_01795 [Candidatus Woykebacteria bacterium RBG_16_39_9b]OGY28012.1 MAG: hypothetical protein A2864_00170 [Candidatus Woykebacteria bacterium RIFCSPHIGHO2_01_FULL_39_12]